MIAYSIAVQTAWFSQRDQTTMTIRPAALEDFPVIANMLHALALKFIVPGMTTEAAADFLRSNDEAALLAYREAGHVTSVAVIDDQVAGFIAVRPPSHVFHLFVAEKWQRRGVARALWEHVFEHAGADIGSFTVNASPYAVQAYLALGFQCNGPLACRASVSFQPMIYR